MKANEFLHKKDVAYMNRLSVSLDFNAIVSLMEEYAALRQPLVSGALSRSDDEDVLENNLPQNQPLQQMAVRRSAFDEVRKWDNEQLRTLLKEVKEMGKLDAPRYYKQSDKMKQLFELEKADYYAWADQFSNVQRAIEVEILWRVRTDAW